MGTFTIGRRIVYIIQNVLSYFPSFLSDEGQSEAAKKYGIFMGAPTCEPMACNAAGEWKIRGKGAYDYVNNSPAVYQFWEDRVKEVAGQEILYTLGMRGRHDGRCRRPRR